jgi:hypothetical protein
MKSLTPVTVWNAALGPLRKYIARHGSHDVPTTTAEATKVAEPRSLPRARMCRVVECSLELIVTILTQPVPDVRPPKFAERPMEFASDQPIWSASAVDFRPTASEIAR